MESTPVRPLRPEARLGRSWWEADRTTSVLECSVGQLLLEAAADVPDSVALIGCSPDPARRPRWTYRELLRDARATAATLLESFAPGERLAVWAPNVPEWQIVQFGAALAGLTVVTLNPAYTVAELRYALAQSRSAGVAVVPEYRGHDLRGAVKSIQHELPELRHVIGLDAGLWEGTGPMSLPEVSPGDVAMIQYTSGTTGFPKGAMLTHRGLVNNARLFSRRFDLEHGSVWLNPLPMFHTGGCTFGAMGTMWQRSAHAVMNFEPGLALELIESERATFFPGVPTMLLAMLEHPDFGRRDLSSLRAVMSGGTTVPPELVRRIEERLDVRFGMIFGQTENSGVIAQSHPGDNVADKTERVGQPLEQTEVRVIDPVTGTVLPCGAVGEFYVRGFGVMQGYFEMPEATADAIDADGWFHTGDLGTMDDRGYLQVTGRVKDMIIRGGENVYPREIEDLLHEDPGIAEVAVVGLPDAYWGEQVAAVVRPAPDTAPAPAVWAARVRGALAASKVPRRWFVTDAMPLTAGGKVRKFRLVEQIAEGALTEIGSGTEVSAPGNSDVEINGRRLSQVEESTVSDGLG
jgi:fatty-acyl-CoA synthase